MSSRRKKQRVHVLRESVFNWINQFLDYKRIGRNFHPIVASHIEWMNDTHTHIQTDEENKIYEEKRID